MSDYSHLSNKRDVTLTNFGKFHPTQNKNPPCMFIAFITKLSIKTFNILTELKWRFFSRSFWAIHLYSSVKIDGKSPVDFATFATPTRIFQPQRLLERWEYFNCFLKIFLICMIVCHIDLLSTFSFSWIPAYNMEIRNMTNQAILLINEFLASTMDLRPWIDVFWQNSFKMPCTIMTAKKKM